MPTAKRGIPCAVSLLQATSSAHRQRTGSMSQQHVVSLTRPAPVPRHLQHDIVLVTRRPRPQTDPTVPHRATRPCICARMVRPHSQSPTHLNLTSQFLAFPARPIPSRSYPPFRPKFNCMLTAHISSRP
ncbi:hypothetical protein EJ06DRAFT_90732 [Trichodelitschia bisporula]|uniref:Uncharacterized protein n=1 Tax=Trichodelitschia bisporula TaxID=703511 RepID=A0A6G1HRX3_9PEZI|nr:hypothetical protein EJ06DRAFT_90732 [Trichodelitschia bisporula]